MQVKYNPELMARNAMKSWNNEEATEKLLARMEEILTEDDEISVSMARLLALNSIEL